MGIKQHMAIRSTVLKGHVKKYAILGLVISISSIIIATLLASYSQTGSISIWGIIYAQQTNPAIWALNLTPFIFAYWGQAFSYELASKAESIIEDKTRELTTRSYDLESKLKYESNHDKLTNLPNERLFMERIQRGMKGLQRNEHLVVIIIAIKDFKDINYHFGNYCANSLLMQFTEKLKAILLEPYMLQAYMGMNMVARLQGSEFGILIPRLHKEHQLNQVIDNILTTTSTEFMIDGHNVKITTVAGVTIHPEHGESEEEIMHFSRLSLTHALSEDKPYVIYNPSMSQSYQEKRLLLKEVSDAIEKEQLQLLYQPVFSLKEGKLISSEVFTSLEDKQYGLTTSDKVLPLIEGTGLTKKLTTFTLTRAIKQLSTWHQLDPSIHLRVGIFNAADDELPTLVETLLKEHNINPECLIIELTEKICLSDQTHTLPVLRALSKLGIKLVISDFASGYSAFTYLPNFPINEIKIDKVFVANMQEEKEKFKIVKGIIKLADAMDMKSIADGIDNEKTLVLLKQLGCTYGQGTYFSHPIPHDEFIHFVKKKSSE